MGKKQKINIFVLPRNPKTKLILFSLLNQLFTVTSIVTVAILFGQPPDGGDQADHSNEVKGHRACAVAQIGVAACRASLGTARFDAVKRNALRSTRTCDGDEATNFTVSFL